MTERTDPTTALMTHFDCSRTAVSTFVKEGCPHTKTPRPGGGRPLTFFSIPEVSQWMKKTGRTLRDGGGDTRSFAARNGKTKNASVADDLDVARERAKLRKELAAAETAELNLEERKGMLISTEEVKMQDMSKIARVRAVLLGGPAVLAQDTTGDPETDEKILAEWVHRALTELSTDEDE